MENKSEKPGISRRKFLGNTALAAAGLTILPGRVISGFGHIAPSDKLNVAVVGIGGVGNANLKRVAPTENIVALCDVDWKYSKHVFDENPGAKRFKDFRKMYDEMGKEIDAVIVATADHTHAIVAAQAMEMGKHVYVQKPLTHTVYESRLLTRLAEKNKVATQMGNQGASGDGVRQTCAWLWNGEIGEVTKVEAFTDRPIWPQGLPRPEKGEWVPETLDWDSFIGPAPMRPYNSIYTPWNFRGWWDFGTGALGDMACHILHPVFMGLKLKYPIKAQGSSTLLLTDSCPSAEVVKIVFPERKVSDRKIKMKFPEVEVHWFDGGLKPNFPDKWPAGKDMNDSGGGVIFHGTKGKLICGCYGVNPWILRPDGSIDKPEVPLVGRKVEASHEMDWVRACKESPENRIKTSSDFSEAGPFNEMVVMGVLAVRLQALNKELEWDGENMRFTNIGPEETLRIVVKDGFAIHDGHPTFDKDFTPDLNAREFAAEMIKHTYREGWRLPDMPL
ncbi:MAG: Gfo/Idh/MocA family oxidoreductase [Prolixibacteraceae bacterium]|nr:Gfo/Idh/MocA family oxidoreductase [Prolixibacteraceae bacterium]